jgi:two-component system, response regulator YesN
MYKIIIVEDEAIVREGIKKRVDWTSLGFSVIGDAANGQEALAIAEKDWPDVILTDIRMPVLDGIELIRIVTERVPSTKVVILTGHEEFEYAHQSIKFGVLDYILKPVSANELSKVMAKVKEMLDHKLNNNQELESLKKQIKQSLPILRDRFLNDLVFTSMREQEIEEKKEFFGVEILGRQFVVMIVEIDDYKLLTERFREEQKQLLNFSVFNIVNETTSQYPKSIAFIARYDYITIIIESEQSSVLTKEKLSSFAEELRKNIEQNLQLTISIGVGNVYQGLERIRNSFREALSILEYKFLAGKNSTIFFSDIEICSSWDSIYPVEIEKQLFSNVKLGNKDEIKRLLNQIVEQITASKSITWGYIQIIFNQLLTLLLKLMQEMNVDLTQIFGAGFNPYEAILKYETIVDLQAWLETWLLKVSDLLTGKRKNCFNILLTKAKEYINANFDNPALALNEVARQVNISNCYFSTLFKEEFGEAFQDYLIRVRIDKAKELLRLTDLKAYEIAYKVGYNDPHYFGVAFKKYVGVTPIEYKEIK